MSGPPARTVLALLAGAILAAAGVSAMQPESRVLVMPFAVTADPAAPGGAAAAVWLGEAASILVEDALRDGGVPVFTRDERVAAFDRLQLPMTPALTRATMIRVGEVVGAAEIVVGDLRLSVGLAVRARLIRLDTGRQFPEIADVGPLPDLFATFDRIGAKLMAATGRRSSTSSAPLAKSAPAFSAFEAYVKGMVAATPAAQQRFLETAMKQAPRDARVLTALWSVYMARGEHEKALAVANAVPPDSPLSRKARFQAARSLIDLKRYDGAVKALNSLNAERAAPVIANALGVVQIRRGGADPASAVPLFMRATAADPDNTDYLFNIGYAYALAKNTGSALQWLRDAVRRDAGNGEDHLVMSAVLAGAGRPVEAGREFELAKLLGTRLDLSAATSPGGVPAGFERLPMDLDRPPLPTLVNGAGQRGQQDTAAFYLEQGRRLFNQQRDREAIGELRRAVYLSAYEDEPHLLLGRIYQRGGRLPDAVDEYKIAIWCRETAEARIALGEALLESGDPAAARLEGERALVISPGNEAARALMKRIGGMLTFLLQR